MSELHINNKFYGLIKFIEHFDDLMRVTLSDGKIITIDPQKLKTMGIVATREESREGKPVTYKMCLITY